MTLFFDPSGPLLQYENHVFRIADLNPEIETLWVMTRWELFKIGLKCLWAAIR